MNTEIIVIAWDLDMRGPLAIRRAANMRHARLVAEDLYQEYKATPRISFFREIDASINSDAVDKPFLAPGGWDEPKRDELA